MNWSIQFDAASEQIVVISRGVLNADQVRAKARAIIDAIQRHGAKRVLVDDREMSVEIGTVDIYRLPELFSSLNLDRSARVALVISSASRQVGDYAFLETVSHNSGYQIRLFTDIDAARQWLMT